jgi:hypothetical protein
MPPSRATEGRIAMSPSGESLLSLFWETAKSSHLSLVLEFSNRYVRPDAAQRAFTWLLAAGVNFEEQD